MKKQAKNELKDKETPVLKQELSDAQRQMFDLRTQAVTQKLENPLRIRYQRRHIARLKTLIHQRELAGTK